MHVFQSRKTVFCAAALLCGLGLSLTAAPAADGDKGFNLSIGANADASAKDVGLPIYPGAWPHKDDSHDDAAAHVWASAGGYGLKVAVVKLGSNDPQGKIEAFYRQALGRYGAVLACTAANAGMKSKGGEASKQLDCGDDHPRRGEVVLKAGTKNNQHIVAIKPNGGGSFIDLVFVQIQGVDD